MTADVVPFAAAAARVRAARLRQDPTQLWLKLWCAVAEAQIAAWRAFWGW